MFFLLLICSLVGVAAATHGEALSSVSIRTDLSRFFERIDPTDATFVLVRGSDGNAIRHNPERAQQRFIPASTFKIPNSLIALETGVADGADFMLPWDPRLKPEAGFWAASWSGDHTLRSAIANSVYWYYQEIARRIGLDRMQHYLDQFDYGNKDLGGGIDRFWLHGNLRISADEQVQFLRNVYRGELPVSERSTAILKEILVLEETPEYRLSGKTGTAHLTATRQLVWLVGCVERSADQWFFALNLEGDEAWERWGNPVERKDLVLRLLRHLHILP